MTVITTYKDAPTQTVDIDGTRFAHRQLGPDNTPPVVFLNHLAAALENWTPGPARYARGAAPRAPRPGGRTGILLDVPGVLVGDDGEVAAEHGLIERQCRLRVAAEVQVGRGCDGQGLSLIGLDA